ncbi:NAD+ synthase [Haloglomus halophilum]|uniref:NAD+ synthase n=1 Tax=Haloglomus halophilum TaxID=2962672 RepID=UPI0020C9FA41|nr:NAD+ synthase [Haloglomus halophilum]
MVDVPRAVETAERFIADYLAESGAEGYVVGVSGGLDSALASRLTVEAVGADAVTGLVLPGAPSSETHTTDAIDLCERLGIDHRVVDIEPVVEAFRGTTPADLGRLALGNVRARTRMVLLYQAANRRDALVLGPENRSEYLLGYFTKYGDGAVDVAPLRRLYKTEFYEVARATDLDDRFAEKQPTAELWEGQTDEAELGADYATIDPVLVGLVERDRSTEAVAAETDADRELVERLAERWASSRHKRRLPPAADLGAGVDALCATGGRDR